MKKQKYSVKTKLTRTKGITLIALVITIIVLLILAGVTISTLTGENGILTKVTEASESTKKANAEEQVKLAVTGSIETDGNIDNGKLKINLDRIENITGVPDTITDQSYPLTVNVDGYDVTIKKEGSIVAGTWKPGNPDTETGIYTEPSTINGETASKNNPTIPVGFKPVNEGEATWGDGSTEPPGVNKGLVIEDVEENQYVWIPVDGILGENGTTIDDVNGTNGEKKILLGRYEYNSNGIPTKYNNIEFVEETQEEHIESGCENRVANDIEEFIDSVLKNGGYYMARFEASKGEDNKADSKYNQSVWSNGGYLSKSIEMAEACQNLYSQINSDLMNSYAWDTAILFIQKNGQGDYSQQTRLLNSIKKSGLSGDVQCNIYDMASNMPEITTETYKGNNLYSSDWTIRGGFYLYSTLNTAGRNNGWTSTHGYSNNTFRPILYF